MYPAAAGSSSLVTLVSGSCVGENCSSNEESSRGGWREGGDQSGKLCHEQQDTILTPLDTDTLYRMTHHSAFNTGWHIFSSFNTGWYIFCFKYRLTHILLWIQGDTYSVIYKPRFPGWRIIPPACTRVTAWHRPPGLWRHCHWYQSRDLWVCPDRIQDT